MNDLEIKNSVEYREMLYKDVKYTSIILQIISCLIYVFAILILYLHMNIRIFWVLAIFGFLYFLSTLYMIDDMHETKTNNKNFF